MSRLGRLLRAPRGACQFSVAAANTPMKIAVVGAGAMGSVYAVSVSSPLCELITILRGCWLRAATKCGRSMFGRSTSTRFLRKVSVWKASVATAWCKGSALLPMPKMQVHCCSCPALSRRAENAGTCDLVIIATKASGVGPAAKNIQSILGRSNGH